jgi:hypothetical protein
MSDLLSAAVSVAGQILEHYEKVQFMKKECGRCGRLVRTLVPLLEQFRAEMGPAISAADQTWMNALVDALRGVLDTVQLCARNPIKARVMPGTYAGKLQKACAAIEDAMKGIGLSSAAVAAEARNAARDLQAEFTDLSGFLTTAQQSNEAFMAQILTAVKNNHEETLRSIAAQNNLSGVEELKRSLAAVEFEKQQLRTEKVSLYRAELECVIELSRAAAGAMESCPKSYKCPITLDIMEDPVILEQSFQTYERKALMHALAERPGVDPMSNQPFEGEPKLIKNYSIRSAIDEWMRSHGGGSGSGGGGGGDGGGGGSLPPSPSAAAEDAPRPPNPQSPASPTEVVRAAQMK